MIRGDTPAGARTRAIDALTDGNLQVLLLQNQAGSLGLNLQACRRAVIIEPDWTDATTQQAIGRIYRAGQTRSCVVEFLLISDSLDEHVVGVARGKAQLAADLIEQSAA
jgi:SNF2 family DNA or RNA helicase